MGKKHEYPVPAGYPGGPTERPAYEQRPWSFNPPSQTNGGIVCPVWTREYRGGWVESRRETGIVLWIKSRSGKLVDKLLYDYRTRFHAAGVNMHCVQWDGERPEALEAVGPVELLEELTEHPAVCHWHLIVSAAVPRLQSANPDRPAPKNVGTNAERAARELRTPKVEKVANAERQRRKELTDGQRKRLERREESQLPQ